ncbi:MAG: glycosyltransferase family 4 protein [Planctomycetota bacterium]|jgi:glycosyltransferase involved in cell wall biosynthesis
MPEGFTEPSLETTVRPVFLVDKSVFQSYSAYIRTILVGLSGTAGASALVCPSGTDPQAILCPSVEHVEHPALRLPIFWSQNRKILVDRLLRFKPTILHTFYPGQVHLARTLSKQFQIPYVVTCHKNAIRRSCFQKSLRHAAKVIAPSKPIADHLTEKCPGLQTRIKQIHIGSFVEDQCSCFSHRANVASLIAVHPLNSLKLFVPFLNAVRHLVLDGFEVMVAIMGTGKAEKAIRLHIRKLGLTSIVTVVPPIRPMRTILTGADLFVHLSDSGQFDAQLLEAMAVGLAVVGSPETTSGLLHDDQTASFWDPQDELNIYGCLKNALGQREKSRQFAQNAQSHLRQHNSVSRMVDKLMNTYIEAQQWHKQSLKTPDEAPAPQTVQ